MRSFIPDMANTLLKYRDIFKSLLVDQLIAERDRWVLWLPVALAAGIAGYFALPVEPPWYLGALGLLLGGTVAWVARSARSLVWLVAISVFAVSLGFTAGQWRTYRVTAPVIEKELRPVGIEGRIVQIENREKGVRITLDRLRISTLGPRQTPGKVRVTLAGKQPPLSLGDWVSGRFGLSPPSPPAAPGAYDFQRRAFFQGIGGVGFSFGPVTVTTQAQSDGMPGVLSGFVNLRRHIALRVSKYFRDRGQARTGSVVVALMTGERGGIPPKAMESFRRSGLAHLLAISGLHIGLIAGIVFFGVRAVLALAGATALKFPIKKWAALAALAGALGYALIAGATVPTIRAFLMIGLVLVAVLFDRRGLSMRLVGFAATAILLVQPEALLGASFQLSFAAVIALIAAYESLSKWRQGRGRLGFLARPGWHRPLLYLSGVALTTLIAGGATAPFAAFHFNQFPHYGMVANVIAVPLTALWVMPWAIIAFALMPVGLEGLALTAMGWGIDIVLNVAAAISHWPGAVSLLPAMPVWALAALALGGLWLCLWRTRWRLFGAGAMAIGIATLGFVQMPDVLIDHRGRLMAVKDGVGGLAVSSRRAGRFTSNIWLRRAALEKASPWPGPKSMAAAKHQAISLSCDGLGCLYSTQGKTIALVTDLAALEEDCAMAAVVISTIAARGRCLGPDLVIDKFDLWRDGAHALWIENQQIRVRSVNGQRGDRPWVLRPGKAKTVKGGT